MRFVTLKLNTMTKQQKINEAVKVLSKRIKKGIKYLEKEKGKNWFKKIDISMLDMDNPHMCVCGQLFDDFWNKFNHEEEDSVEEAGDMGFHIETCKETNPYINYDILQILWSKKILELNIKNLK